MRRQGSTELLEYRRRLAVSLLDEGQTHAEAADALDVSVRSVQRWAAALAAGGEAALRIEASPGRPPKLDAAAEARVLSWVGGSDATAFGFPTPRWTAPRLAAVVARELGVRFNPRYLCAWLAQRGITPQVPALVARERDPDAVRRWLARDWPRIKKGRDGSGRAWSSPTRAAF